MKVGDMVRFRWGDGEEYEGELVEPLEPEKNLDALVRVRGPWPLGSQIYVVTEKQFLQK